MKLVFTGAFRFPPEYLMRRCGYGRIANRSGQVSFVRILGRSGFPRFHAYVDTVQDGLQVNLHLDQKQPTYGEHTAHSGEYEGTVVEQEGARITASMQQMRR